MLSIGNDTEHFRKFRVLISKDTSVGKQSGVTVIQRGKVVDIFIIHYQPLYSN